MESEEAASSDFSWPCIHIAMSKKQISGVRKDQQKKKEEEIVREDAYRVRLRVMKLSDLKQCECFSVRSWMRERERE